MNNLTVSKRLIFAFSVMLAIIVSLAIGSWYLLDMNKREIDTIVNEDNLKISLSYKMRGSLNLVARSVRNYIIYNDDEMRKKIWPIELPMSGKITTRVLPNLKHWSTRKKKNN